MASDNQSANEQMVQLITRQTIDFLATLNDNIVQCKNLSAEDRKNCEQMCQQGTFQYNRLKIQFFKETVTLFDTALNTSDDEQLKEIHHAWSLQLDYFTQECEKTTRPLIQMLRILSRNDKSFRKKYWGYTGGSALSALFVGAAVGVLIAHYHPACVLQLAAEAVVVVSVGALVAIAIGIGCLTGLISINTIWRSNQKCSDSIRLIINKHCGPIVDKSGKIPSELQLTKVIRDNLDVLKITDDMWHMKTVLQSFKRTLESEINDLRQIKS